MNLYTINYIKNNQLLYNYLRENSYWYKYLNRNQEYLKPLEEEQTNYSRQNRKNFSRNKHGFNYFRCIKVKNYVKINIWKN